MVYENLFILVLAKEMIVVEIAECAMFLVRSGSP